MVAASVTRHIWHVAVTSALVALPFAGLAQGLPDAENGRYAISRVADGALRLDTKTGSVSTCTNKGNGWACYAIPDERAALDTEIGRLQKENEGLRTQLAERPAPPPKTDEAQPKADPLAPKTPYQDLPKSADGERKLEIPLPSDKDMDRVMGFSKAHGDGWSTWPRGFSAIRPGRFDAYSGCSGGLSLRPISWPSPCTFSRSACSDLSASLTTASCCSRSRSLRGSLPAMSRDVVGVMMISLCR